jgi:putative protein-disulfide isomerase
VSLEKIIYVADPMCSWCWGFAPEIEKLRQAYTHIPMTLVMGGLRQGHAWDSDFRHQLAAHWRAVEQTSGQPFNHGLLEQAAFDYTTEPACRAVVAWRQIGDDLAFYALKKLQMAFYVQNVDITNDAVIISLFSDHPQFQRFTALFASEQTIALTHRDTQQARLYGVSVFPSLVLLDDEGHLSVIKGYRKFEELTRMLAV